MAWRKTSAALLLLPALLAAGDLHRFEATQPHMGTQFRIVLYAADKQQAERGFAAAFARVRELDSILSDYNPDSELNRLCAWAGQGPAPVSADLFIVLAKAQEIAQETDGAFDVTLGPAIRLWRAARREHRLPTKAERATALARCGYRNMILDAAHRTVQLKLPGMQLDVGGLGKGYTADQALQTLSRMGLAHALVAASGDLAMGDAPPGESGWRVGLDLPGATGSPFARILRLKNCAVSTAGDTEQYVEIEGRRYSHILDPHTRLGLTSGIAVSVIAPHGIDADVLDTTASVLGPEQGLALLERHGVAAVIAIDGRFLETPPFRELPLQ